jgi:hypothetical protein
LHRFSSTFPLRDTSDISATCTWSLSPLAAGSLTFLSVLLSGPECRNFHTLCELAKVLSLGHLSCAETGYMCVYTAKAMLPPICLAVSRTNVIFCHRGRGRIYTVCSHLIPLWPFVVQRGDICL